MGIFLRRLCIVLLPVAAFAAALIHVRDMLGQEGQGVQGIALFLGALAILAVVEGLLFRYWLLPALGEAIGQRVYGGSYLPEDDALVCLLERVRDSRDAALLPELRSMVAAQGWRVRGWLELARTEQDVFADPQAALQTLLEGERRVRDKEDRALLLLRAARLCENVIHDSAAARTHYTAAAERYPRTVYGAKSAEALGMRK